MRTGGWQLLAVLAAHLPAGARVLELGTGAGVGTAWIASGLLPRADVTVITIEKDPQTAALAAHGAWPQFVDLRVGDALDVLGEAGAFELVFADAPGGKWSGLDRTIAALAPHGLLVVDDMTDIPEWATGQHASRPPLHQADPGVSRQSSIPHRHTDHPLCTRCWCSDLNLNPRTSARRAFSPSLIVTLRSAPRLLGRALSESLPDGQDGQRSAGQARPGSSGPLCRRQIRMIRRLHHWAPESLDLLRSEVPTMDVVVDRNDRTLPRAGDPKALVKLEMFPSRLG